MKHTAARSRPVELHPTTAPQGNPAPSGSAERSHQNGRGRMRPNRLVRRLIGRVQDDLTPAGHHAARRAATPTPAQLPEATCARCEKTTSSPGQDGRKAHGGGRVGHAAVRLTTRLRAGFDEALSRPDRGDISITTVIIWVAAVTGALLIAGTIAAVIARYNGQLNGL